jgi:hypothetical protein
VGQQALVGAPLVIGTADPDPEQDLACPNRILEVCRVPRNKPVTESLLEAPGAEPMRSIRLSARGPSVHAIVSELCANGNRSTATGSWSGARMVLPANWCSNARQLKLSRTRPRVRRSRRASRTCGQLSNVPTTKRSLGCSVNKTPARGASEASGSAVCSTKGPLWFDVDQGWRVSTPSPYIWERT